MPLQSESRQFPILVFDVNETLLDLNALRPSFERVFGSGEVLREWFTQTLLYSQTMTLTGHYADFAAVARHSLEMTARTHAVQLNEEAVASIFATMRTLPTHQEVPGALRRLRQAGFRMIALTNSSQSMAEAQMLSAGLTATFERIISVDAIRKYKPFPGVYRHLAVESTVNTSQLTMIAAHPWDLMGARAAGCNVAYIERPSTPWFDLVPKPKIAGRNLDEVATQLMSGPIGADT